MKRYLTIVSIIILISSLIFIWFWIFIPYAALNLIFLYLNNPPSWIRPTLQYSSLTLAILAGILAMPTLLINTPDFLLMPYALPLSFLLIHGIIEFRYLKGLSSTEVNNTNLEIE